MYTAVSAHTKMHIPGALMCFELYKLGRDLSICCVEEIIEFKIQGGEDQNHFVYKIYNIAYCYCYCTSGLSRSPENLKNSRQVLISMHLWLSHFAWNVLSACNATPSMKSESQIPHIFSLRYKFWRPL